MPRFFVPRLGNCPTRLEPILHVEHDRGATAGNLRLTMSEVSDSAGKTFRCASVTLRSIDSPLNEDSMEERYSWQVAYQSAILETDDAAISLRIYEALAAIEQRRLSFLEIGGEEERALEDAERELLTLKAERVDPSGTE